MVVISKKLFVSVLVLFGLSQVGCNGAKFTSSPTKKNSKTTQKNEKVSCSVSPGTVALGQTATISVFSSNDAQIFQKIVGGQQPLENKLVRSGSNYVLENGSANIVKPLENGSYTVELRLTHDGKVAGSCRFDVGGSTTSLPANTLGCEFVSKKVPLGTRLPINVVSNSNYRGSLTQRIQGPSSSGEQTVLKNVGSGWVRENNSPNIYTFDRIGNYTIDFSLNDSVANRPSVRSCQVIVETPICEDGQESIGAHVAFIVDNSNSNSATDCPNSRLTGHFNGADTYECLSETNRERAVLSAVDILEGITLSNSVGTNADSSVSIVSFPTRQNYTDGYRVETQGWIAVRGSQYSTISNAMRFARQPFGLTPYGSAITAASQLFRDVPNDGRAKVAVLVTDGEPTDHDPISVATQAESLKNSGVEVVTIFITGVESAQQRKAKHAQMLERFNTWSLNNGQGPWYSDNIRSFDEYVELINGSNWTSDLVHKVSSPVDTACYESEGRRCARRIVEITDSASLKVALERVIKTERFNASKKYV
ncbi:MAG: vWA domain-containing protein [Bdellovibrionota bacterium]